MDIEPSNIRYMYLFCWLHKPFQFSQSIRYLNCMYMFHETRLNQPKPVPRRNTYLSFKEKSFYVWENNDPESYSYITFIH